MTTTETTVFNSPTASATRKAMMSEPQLKMAAKLNALILSDPTFKTFQLLSIDYTAFEREETRANGESRVYVPDILLLDKLTGIRYSIECMGEGSASDDPLRHDFFIRHGIFSYYVENRDVTHAIHLVVRDLRLKVKLMRALWV